MTPATPQFKRVTISPVRGDQDDMGATPPVGQLSISESKIILGPCSKTCLPGPACGQLICSSLGETQLNSGHRYAFP